MIQTRSEVNGINHFNTFQEAIKEANKDKTIWKISFDLNGERVRLVRRDDITWSYEPILLPSDYLP